MPIIHYVLADGSKVEADVAVGESVMQGAIDNMVDGILGECGGACACATCHCYVDSEWKDKLPSADPIEAELLDAAYEPKDNSRLSCQLSVTEEMNGLVVQVPERQY